MKLLRRLGDLLEAMHTHMSTHWNASHHNPHYSANQGRAAVTTKPRGK